LKTRKMKERRAGYLQAKRCFALPTFPKTCRIVRSR